MEILLKYGNEGIPVNLPDTPGFQGVLEPSEPEPISDPMGAVEQSLLSPTDTPALGEVALGKKDACIVISDITRPVPNEVILPPIIETLERVGIESGAITILVATGIHRPSSDEEVIRLVGKNIAEKYRVIDHYSKVREDMVEVGMINGEVPALVNKTYVNADLKILTGFIEPHMWAGFSGGRKSLLPGISSVETLQYMHGPEMVAHEATIYGKLDGNPFHEAGLQVLELAGGDFVVNVTLDTSKRVTGVFAGDCVTAHRKGCDFLAEHCMREVDGVLDFIVTTNAGAPLDCNLYQTVKGITGAAPAVKEGGDILIASQCLEGPGSPEYREILELVDTPANFVNRIMAKEFFIPDQWCAQETYQVVRDRNVHIFTEGFTHEELERYHFNPVADVGEGLKGLLEKHGPEAKWAVIPDGPMVILKVKG